MEASQIPQMHHVALRSSEHATSADPEGAKAAMTAVLRGDAALRRRLCRLLEVDYACLGYDVSRCVDGSALGGAGE